MSSSFGARPWQAPDELDDDEGPPELVDPLPAELEEPLAELELPAPDEPGPTPEEPMPPLPPELSEPGRTPELETPEEPRPPLPPELSEPGPAPELETPEEPRPLLPPELSEPGPAPELEVPPPSSPAVRPPQPPTIAKTAADSAPASAIDAPYTGVAAFVCTLPSEEPLGWRASPITPRDAPPLAPSGGDRGPPSWRGRYLMCASVAGASPATSVRAR